MNPTMSLTDRVLAVLAGNLEAEVTDIWDIIGDASLTRAEVSSEVRALVSEGKVERGASGVLGPCYRLAAQVMAS